MVLQLITFLCFFSIILIELLLDFELFYAKLGFSWFFSLTLNKLFLLIMSLIVILNIKKLNKKTHRVFLMFFLGVGWFVSFWKTPLYKEDFNKRGVDITGIYKDNDFCKRFNKLYPNYKGMLCLANVGCPHCKRIAKKIEIVKKRSPNLNICFVLFSTEGESITSFKRESGAKNIDCELIKESEELAFMEICEGKFPTFLYVANNDFIYKWSARQFGSRALDWVEKGFVY